MGTEDLARAAAAAGFAMATVDDDTDSLATPASAALQRSTEDLARGARPPRTNVALPVANRSVVPPAEAKGLMASATSVRDVVYGYLGRGVPA